MSVSEERVKQRIEGRRLANALLDMMDNASDTIINFDPDDPDMCSPLPMREAFVNQMASQLGVQLVAQQNLPKMTDEQAKKFEQRLVGFGRHAEQSYAECPTDYLLWLQEKQIELSAYLRSDHAQKRQV